MNNHLRISAMVASDGERVVFVIDERTGLPDPTCNLYMLNGLREQAGSHATVEQSLRGAVAIQSFLLSRGIDFASRVADGSLLTQSEIIGFAASLEIPAAPPTCPRRLTAKVRRKSSRSGGREKPATRGRNPRTRAIRMAAAAAFLDWLIQFQGEHIWSTLEQRAAGRLLTKAFVENFRARKPRAGAYVGRSASTPNQRAVLHAALHSAADKAFASGSLRSMFAAERQMLWQDTAEELGLRTGEMLSLRKSDFQLDDVGNASVDVVRRPDASDDPRMDLPRVKGDGRNLPLSPYLAGRFSAHFGKWRARLPAAAGHDFAFVSARGTPLSKSTVREGFKGLRGRSEGIGPDFCSHTNRHDWNYDFSVSARERGLSQAQEASERAYAMGWRDPRSARFYLGRYVREGVAEANLASQRRRQASRAAHHA